MINRRELIDARVTRSDWFGEGKLLSEKNDAKRYKLAAKISYRI